MLINQKPFLRIIYTVAIGYPSCTVTATFMFIRSCHKMITYLYEVMYGSPVLVTSTLLSSDVKPRRTLLDNQYLLSSAFDARVLVGSLARKQH